MNTPADFDIGRSFSDPPCVDPRFEMRPLPPLPWTRTPTLFRIESNGRAIERPVYHPHLALLRIMKEGSFPRVLDIGCGDGNEAALFGFLGADVTTINTDRSPDTQVTFFGDYLNFDAPHKYDLIWCSHVLEHVRNPGAFLDKVFADLKIGGTLAISVPYNDFGSENHGFILGHHNRYNISLLIYQLVCAGFDCSGDHLAIRVYNGQISVVLRKHPIGTQLEQVAPRNTAATAGVDQVVAFPLGSEIYNLNWDTFYKNGPPIPESKVLWKDA